MRVANWIMCGLIVGGAWGCDDGAEPDEQVTGDCGIVDDTGARCGESPMGGEGGGCVPEGVRSADVQPRCCDGLAAIPDLEGADGQCMPASPGMVCAACGDGVCGLGETACNCAGDCGTQCVPAGGARASGPDAPACCEGLSALPAHTAQPSGACDFDEEREICSACGDGACDPGENACNCPADCAPPCYGEGETRPTGLDDDEVPACCEGLIALSCAGPSEFGMCFDCIGTEICTACGDGTCGIGENDCNCPADCDAEAACVPAGETVPVVPDAPECCEGLQVIGCAAPNADGMCEDCEGASICATCGDAECGAGENPCNCPADCPAE